MCELFTTRRARAWLVLAVAALSLPARAQESVRMSLAGAQAAEARRKAAAAVDYYNLKLGPTAWRFGTGLGIEGNDNLRGDATNPQSDVIFRPKLDAQMRLPVSEVNTLNLALAGGYAFYVEHTEYDRPFITPGSELALDLYAGDCWLNLHDRFALVDQAYLDPTVTGIGNYERLDNTAGLALAWDLNKIVAKLGYDHRTYRSLGANPALTDGDAEVFAASAGYLLRPGRRAGLDLGASLLHYSAASAGPAFTDGTEWSAGVFYEDRLTDYIEARLSAGYTAFVPDAADAAALGQEFSGVYAQLGFTHRLNKWLAYAVSGGRILNFGFYGGLLDQYFARLDVTWQLLRKTAIETTFNYQHGSQFGAGGETFDWFGPVLNLNRKLTAHLTGSLAYQYYWRTSDLPNRNYSVNLITASLLYRF